MVKKIKPILFSIPFIILLAMVRMYEETWFYDPFLSYFKSDYQSLPFPEFESGKLFISLTFRYILNTLFSLAIIYVLFRNLEHIKVASFLYLFFYLILIGIFFYIINFLDKSNFVLFYTRRFLIQPLFLLLFLPGFYFQSKLTDK